MVGLIEYLVQSNDNADCVETKDKYKYVDDLTILDLICLSQVLTEYNCYQHVPNDIGIDQKFIPPEDLKTQSHLNYISEWTHLNKMKLNEDKSKYMIFKRVTGDITTRLKMNDVTIERIEEAKIVGVWLTSDLKWAKNTKELCRRAYARITMITKLKYAGTHRNDLIDIYMKYIRSILEYCSVVWHSSLTQQQTNNLESVQKLCLKIILGTDYKDYDSALQQCSLEKLVDRREARCLKFGLKSLTHPKHCKMFPINPQLDAYDTRRPEHFHVNRANTEQYRKSTIPYIQRKLNNYVNSQK